MARPVRHRDKWQELSAFVRDRVKEVEFDLAKIVDGKVPLLVHHRARASDASQPPPPTQPVAGGVATPLVQSAQGAAAAAAAAAAPKEKRTYAYDVAAHKEFFYLVRDARPCGTDACIV